MIDLIARVEGCSRSEARRLAPSVTFTDGLYRRGKKHANWRWVVDGAATDLSGGDVGLLLGEYAERGITPLLQEAVTALVRGDESPVVDDARARVAAEILRRRAEERCHSRTWVSGRWRSECGPQCCEPKE